MDKSFDNLSPLLAAMEALPSTAELFVIPRLVKEKHMDISLRQWCTLDYVWELQLVGSIGGARLQADSFHDIK